MFKKFFAIAALVGMAFMANASVASAHSDGYKKHHNHGHHYGYKKPHWKHGYGYNRGIPLPVIRKKLRHRGYHRIRFVDRYLPVYKARVCKRGQRYKLRINRWGEVVRRKRIGYCGPRRHYGYHSKW